MGNVMVSLLFAALDTLSLPKDQFKYPKFFVSEHL